jgi:AraC-like DNA-binding protein
MSPDFELIQKAQSESFRAWGHDYPHPVARWNFHPEYEIHLITSSSGKMFVGDHVGPFAPGNLVIVGPNLPHNWVSDLGEGERVPGRDLVVQFSAAFVQKCLAVFPELAPMRAVLNEADHGVQFPDALGLALAPLVQELTEAKGCRRVELLIRLFGTLQTCRTRRTLTARSYRPDVKQFMSSKINRILMRVQQDLATGVSPAALADWAGISVTTLSRLFRKHTGTTFVKYVTWLRISQACELLAYSNLEITEICYRVGFNNLSNFNRQFRRLKQFTPSEFRAYHRLNAKGRGPAAPVPAPPARLLPAARQDGLAA